jgi:hypothetical protein
MNNTTQTEIKFLRDKHAPIPDYHSECGRWRIYQSSTTKNWIVQDRSLASSWRADVAECDSLNAAKRECAVIASNLLTSLLAACNDMAAMLERAEETVPAYVLRLLSQLNPDPMHRAAIAKAEGKS